MYIFNYFSQSMYVKKHRNGYKYLIHVTFPKHSVEF